MEQVIPRVIRRESFLPYCTRFKV